MAVKRHLPVPVKALPVQIVHARNNRHEVVQGAPEVIDARTFVWTT